MLWKLFKLYLHISIKIDKMVLKYTEKCDIIVNHILRKEKLQCVSPLH